MTTQLHERSIHIDAPVEKVFDFVKEPANFIAAFPEKDRAHMALIETDMKPEGVGSTYRIMGRMLLLFHMEWTITRKQFVPNELIVDAAQVGGVWTYTFETDGDGTMLSLGFGWSDKWPKVAGEVADRLGWNGDQDLDVMLMNLRKAVEG